MNRLGDLFAIFDDGSIHMLDVGVGTLTRLADNRDDFSTKTDQGDNAENWLMLSLAACDAANADEMLNVVVNEWIEASDPVAEPWDDLTAV